MLPNVINAAMYYAPSAWKVWIDHVIRHEHSLGLSKAALVRHNGLTASATCDFVLGQNDIKVLEKEGVKTKAGHLQKFQVLCIVLRSRYPRRTNGVTPETHVVYQYPGAKVYIALDWYKILS